MYQFTTTTVINSDKDSSLNIDKYVGSATELKVARVGTFKNANITSIHKHAYHAAVNEIGALTVPALTTGDVVRISVSIKLSQSTNAEYAETSRDFHKPVELEVIYGASASATATLIASELNKLKTRFGYKYFNTESSGTGLTFTANDEFQRFASITLSKGFETSSVVGVNYVVQATGSVTTAGKVGFGNDSWMMRAISIPTNENTKAFGMNEDERPVLGGQYSQYTLRYSIAKDGDDGILGGRSSITTHVFYVKASLVSDFETELDKLSVAYGINITGTAELANSATSQLTAVNAVGGVTWAVDSGTSATVSADGLVTAHATTDGDTDITATDATGAVATITITVA